MKKIPRWAEFSICLIIFSILVRQCLHSQNLEPTGKMKNLAESILNGDIYSKSVTIWKLQYLDPVDAASLVNVLFSQIDNETPAHDSIVQEYNKRMIAIAGELADFYIPKTVSIGDLAALSISRIRLNLIIETSGDGGPTTTLTQVRNVIAKNALQLLCSGNDKIKLRILKDILPGDRDPAPIKAILSCCFNDTNPLVKTYAASFFFGYSMLNRKCTFTAVPKLIELVKDPDVHVSHAAQNALRIFSNLDFGSDAESWKKWFSKYESQYR